MELDLFKFVIAIAAGSITVFTPCTFPFLPVILWRSLGGKSWKKPLTILTSLALSLFVFGIIFNATIKFAGLTQHTLAFWWGFVIALFGYITIVPEVWDKIMDKLGFFSKSKKVMETGVEKNSMMWDILIGLFLWPVFTGCSPVLLAILPLISESSKVVGSLYLIAYILWLVWLLFLIAIFGQRLTRKLQFATNPHGKFKRNLGVLLLVIGIMIMTGWDKKFEAWMIEKNILPASTIEQSLWDIFE